jgi:hypothetical protein
MSKRGAQVLEEALSLRPAERAELVDRLLTSLDSPPERNLNFRLTDSKVAVHEESTDTFRADLTAGARDLHEAGSGGE